MLTAKQAKSRARLLDPDWKRILNDLTDKIADQTEWYPEEKHCLFDMAEDQEYTDDVVEHLEKLGYEASWNDCLLCVEISWKNAEV